MECLHSMDPRLDRLKHTRLCKVLLLPEGHCLHTLQALLILPLKQDVEAGHAFDAPCTTQP
eukprot:1159878-Pelagomonas_calceolata.AAC.6